MSEKLDRILNRFIGNKAWTACVLAGKKLQRRNVYVHSQSNKKKKRATIRSA